MRVSQGRRIRFVSGELLHFEQRNSGGDETRAKRVAQIVIAKRGPEICLLRGLLEPKPPIERSVVSLRRDVRTPRALPHARETAARGAADLHGARSGFSFDVENAFVDLPVVPHGVELLSATHPREDREFDFQNFARTLLADRSKQPTLFLAREKANVNRRFLRTLDVPARERIHLGQSLPDGVAEDRTKKRVKPVDRRALYRAVRSVATRKILKEPLDPSRRELAKLQMPDCRKHAPQPHAIRVNRGLLVPAKPFCFERRLYEIPESQLALCPRRSCGSRDLSSPREVLAFFVSICLHVAFFLPWIETRIFGICQPRTIFPIFVPPPDNIPRFLSIFTVSSVRATVHPRKEEWVSVQAMSWVIEKSRQKGSNLLVLLMIANHAHTDGRGAYQSIATLARESRLSVRGVQYILAKLESSSELVIERDAGPRGTNLYSLPFVVQDGFNLRGLPANFSGRATGSAPSACGNLPAKFSPHGGSLPAKSDRSTGKSFAPEPKRTETKNQNLRPAPPCGNQDRKTAALPQQRRFAIVGCLTNAAEKILDRKPNCSDGDLADELKQWAASEGIPYFDAWPGAATPIEQAITNATARRKTA